MTSPSEAARNATMEKAAYHECGHGLPLYLNKNLSRVYIEFDEGMGEWGGEACYIREPDDSPDTLITLFAGPLAEAMFLANPPGDDGWLFDLNDPAVSFLNLEHARGLIPFRFIRGSESKHSGVDYRPAGTDVKLAIAVARRAGLDPAAHLRSAREKMNNPTFWKAIQLMSGALHRAEEFRVRVVEPEVDETGRHKLISRHRASAPIVSRKQVILKEIIELLGSDLGL